MRHGQNLLQKTVDLAFYIAQAYIDEDTVAADATCGNGHDTLALLEAGVKNIYAFDIQDQALKNTEALIRSHLPSGHTGECPVKLIKDSHENMGKYIDSLDICIFNLGYLPGGDRSIVTRKESSAKAFMKALELLNPGGLVICVLYQGHDEGRREKAEILRLAENLDSSEFHAAFVSMINQHRDPPEVLLVTRKKRRVQKL